MFFREFIKKKYVPSAYSYSSFYNSKKYFRVVKMSLKNVTNFFLNPPPLKKKDTLFLFLLIFNLAFFFSFLNFLGMQNYLRDATYISVEKRYFAKNHMIKKLLLSKDEKKNIMSIMPLPFLSLISLLLHNTLYFYDVKYKYLVSVLILLQSEC